MKRKLIKINDNHYMIVNDSEIKEGEPALHNFGMGYEIEVPCDPMNLKSNTRFRITHSTKPLEIIKIDTMYEGESWSKIKQLSLSEVEEVINGYSWKTEFEKANLKYGSEQHSFFLGFKAHQELVKDKLFTKRDMIAAYTEGTNAGANYESLIDYDSDDREEAEEFSKNELHDFIQSLHPKTEWDIEFDEQGKIKLL